MKKLALVITVALSLLATLAGCGQNEEKETYMQPEPITPAFEPTLEVIQATPSQAPEKKVTMESLVITDNFTFTTQTHVSVLIDLPEYSDDRAYISMYRDYKRVDKNKYYPIADTRVLSGPLIKGAFAQSFVSINNQQTYLAQVWFFDERAPLQKMVTVIEGKINW